MNTVPVERGATCGSFPYHRGRTESRSTIKGTKKIERIHYSTIEGTKKIECIHSSTIGHQPFSAAMFIRFL
jgi:hypothetical protein